MKTILSILTATIVLSSCSIKQDKTEQVSTIDNSLQTKVTSILESKLNGLNAQSGQAIIMDVQTGSFCGKELVKVLYLYKIKNTNYNE